MLEQITGEVVTEDQEKPTPKGMVRTEMGRLVKKADQDAQEKKGMAAMQAELKSRGAAKAKLAAMSKKK